MIRGDNVLGGGGIDPRAAGQLAQQPAAPPVAPTPAAPAPETPTDVGGSAPPPASGGDAPSPSFPVPPVPPPPAPGPIFSLAGGGGGGATSFARPGTEAAKPFRSQLFATNRSSAGGMGQAAPTARFGAGTPVTTGGIASTLPAGLEGDATSAAGANPGDELARILAALRGGAPGA